MARELTKKCYRETVRFDETESGMIFERAAEEGVSRGAVVRSAVRMYLELEDVQEEHVRKQTPKRNERVDI